MRYVVLLLSVFSLLLPPFAAAEDAFRRKLALADILKTIAKLIIVFRVGFLLNLSNETYEVQI